jgi:hypothetical protein
MKPKLRAVKHDADRRLWCGPAAIASVTGLKTSKVYPACDAVVGHNARKMYQHQVAAVLRDLGFTAYSNVVPNPRPTFTAFRRERQPHLRKTPLIVYVTGHFLVLQGNRVVDNKATSPILASESRSARRRVKGYIELV